MGAVIQVAEDAIPAGLKLDFGPEGETMDRRMNELRQAAETRAKTDYFDNLRGTGGKYDPRQIDYWAAHGLSYPQDIFPKAATLQNSVRIPDYFSDQGIYLVSQAFRDLVEEFDGGVHQFIELPIRTMTGEAYAYGPYYIFINRQVLNSIVPSGMQVIQQPNRAIPDELLDVRVVPGMQFTVSAAAVGGAGIWREKRHYFRDFISTRFAEQLAKQKLVGWESFASFSEVA